MRLNIYFRVAPSILNSWIRPRPPVRRVLPLVAIVLLALPAIPAQTEAVPATFLVYHTPGGRDPDPLASPLAPPPDGTERLPATLFDRQERAHTAPENAPESALAHYREFQRAMARRESEPAGARITLTGELAPSALRVEADVSDGPATLTLVVFEHGVPLAGRPQPYVARFVARPLEVPPGGGRVASQLHLDPAWDPERIGVVAIASEGTRVLQSATWTPRLDAPTIQTRRAVLVEHVTASWCDPCRPADEAFALLATQRGAAGALDAGDVAYFRAPTPLFYAGLALGSLVALALARRSAP